VSGRLRREGWSVTLDALEKLHPVRAAWSDVVLRVLEAEGGTADVRSVGAALRQAGHRVGQTTRLVEELRGRDFTVVERRGQTVVTL